MPRLADVLTHLELEVAEVFEDEQRPRFRCRVVREKVHRAFLGYNRSKLAVIEAAVLSSRLHMLPREKVESEIAYLNIAVSKTAAAEELEAWEWLMEKIRKHYDAKRD